MNTFFKSILNHIIKAFYSYKFVSCILLIPIGIIYYNFAKLTVVLSDIKLSVLDKITFVATFNSAIFECFTILLLILIYIKMYKSNEKHV